MAIRYVVRADVIDIRRDAPQPTDAFLVDSNVWSWVTYTRASLGDNPPLPHQSRHYPAYINRAAVARSRLLRCGLSLAELSHVIERTEREIYENVQGIAAIKNKEFRHNLPAERANVAAEIKTAWEQVKSMSEPIDILIDDPMTDAALSRFQTQPVDGYDLFLIEAVVRAGIVQVITDDGDYCTVPAITVFTGNQAVIAAATTQRKLVVR